MIIQWQYHYYYMKLLSYFTIKLIVIIVIFVNFKTIIYNNNKDNRLKTPSRLLSEMHKGNSSIIIIVHEKVINCC